VRFLYLRRPEWYLSVDLNERRDVIEIPIDGLLDISGWDLKKALALFRKSNPPLLEWLGSPLVYREHASVVQEMRDLLPTYYSPNACLYHYLHMAQRNYREFLKGDRVLLKKYLYVLRPIVSIRWIEKDLGVVPTQFRAALDAVVDDPALRAAIEQLLETKEAGQELDYGPRIPVLSAFLESELERIAKRSATEGSSKPSCEPLNALFRNALRVWRQDA
jgi:predicted nucleotidyltransferase